MKNKPAPKPKSTMVSFRLTTETLINLDRLANKAARTRSNYIKMLILQAILKGE